MENTNLTLEELEYIIYSMNKTPIGERTDNFKKCYAKLLLLTLLELEQQNQQKATL